MGIKFRSWGDSKTYAMIWLIDDGFLIKLRIDLILPWLLALSTAQEQKIIGSNPHQSKRCWEVILC
jgi:hypothetical protein